MFPTNGLGTRLFPFGAKKRVTLPPKFPHMETISHGDVNLLIIRNAEKKDQDYLRSKYNFHPVHLDDLLSLIQRPKLDIEEDYLFFVLQFPEFNNKTNRIESNEIDFFYSEKDIIVVINDPYPQFEAIIEKINKKKSEKERFFAKGTGLLIYQLIDDLVDSIFPLVEQIERGLELIDKQVFLEQAKNVVERISFLRRNLIFFQTMVKPELAIFRGIEESDHKLITKELKTYFGNITDHFVKLWDRLEDAKELTENLSTTVETYLTLKTNETIKVLTMFSVVMLPLTLISGIYGMNLNMLPFANHPLAFVMIAGIMLAIAYLMLAFFKYKRWI